ncbi:GSCOCG00006212001-RA-CDS, partial [Cotesia congregata]
CGDFGDGVGGDGSRSGVGDWCSELSNCWCGVVGGVGCGCSVVGGGSWCYGFHGNLSGFFADDGVESVDTVCGVVDSSASSVRFEEAVAALD